MKTLFEHLQEWIIQESENGGPWDNAYHAAKALQTSTNLTLEAYEEIVEKAQRETGNVYKDES